MASSGEVTMTKIVPWSLHSLSVFLSTLPHAQIAPMDTVRKPDFAIPPVAITSTIATPALDFYHFNSLFWIELLAFSVAIAALAAVVGGIVYQFIVRKDAQFTPSSYLVGYGVVLPFWLCFPYIATYHLGVTNKIHRFCMTVMTPGISIFRTTAAMHGFSPEHVTYSVSDFAFYYACPILTKYDPESKQYAKATFATIKNGIFGFIQMLTLTGILVSVYNEYPNIFPLLAKPSYTETKDWYDWSSLFDLRQLWENICYAVTFQCYLTTFAEGLMLIQAALTTYEPEQGIMSNPVFSSTSPSDFWGRRWNMLIHDVLKRGVFLPVRRYYPTVVALMTCFFASGVYHEWLCISVFPAWDHEYIESKDADDAGTCRLVGRDGEYEPLHCYKPKYGASVAFFMWQAALIALEFSIGRFWKKRMLPKIPAPLATIITIALGGCVAHWFAEPYVHSNFFLDGEQFLYIWKRAS